MKRFRVVIDVLMMLLTVVLMGGNLLFTANIVHEVCGVLTFVLWITHITLNRRWYVSFCKRPLGGKQTKELRQTVPVLRVIQAIINFGIVICTVFLIISGILISNHVFVFLHIESGMSFARAAHLVASHWYFVFMSLHVGLHAGVLANAVQCRRPSETGIGDSKKHSAWQKTRTIVFRIVIAAASVYGVYAFIVRGIGKYLLYRQPFFFFDLSRGYVLFVADYGCMMILIAMISYVTAKLCHSCELKKTVSA